MNSYYGKEEEVETPETQLDNFRAQAGATQAVEVWAQETLGTLYDQTVIMWNQAGDMRAAAEQRGDGQAVEQLTNIQNNLTMLYQGTEQMQQALLTTTAGAKSVLEGAEALAKQKEAIENQLTKLVTAVEQADLNNPHIEQMAEMIETDLYEMISYNEQFYDPTPEVYDDTISQMVTVIQESAPKTTYAIVERLFHTLIGDFEMDDTQRELLLSLVSTITLDDEAHDND